MTPFDLLPPAGEDLVLLRAVAALPGGLNVTERAADDPLARALRAAGLGPYTPDHAPAVLLVDDAADPAEQLASRPAVVAVAQREAPSARPWPGWDQVVVSAGYEPCLFTGRWRFYVAREHAEQLGPLLGHPPLTDELAAAGRALEVADEVRVWRAAALERWASIAEQAAPPADAAAAAQIATLRAELDALRATVSWRVTAPLRALQAARRRSSR